MSGVLVTTVTLDRETRANYLLSVQAQDSAGINSLSSVTQVTVAGGAGLIDGQPVVINFSDKLFWKIL